MRTAKCWQPGGGGSPERREVGGQGWEFTRFQNSTVGSASLHPAQCLAASAFGLTHAWWGRTGQPTPAEASGEPDRSPLTARTYSGPSSPAPPASWASGNGHQEHNTRGGSLAWALPQSSPTPGLLQPWQRPQPQNLGLLLPCPGTLHRTAIPSPSGKSEETCPEDQALPSQEK